MTVTEETVKGTYTYTDGTEKTIIAVGGKIIDVTAETGKKEEMGTYTIADNGAVSGTFDGNAFAATTDKDGRIKSITIDGAEIPLTYKSGETKYAPVFTFSGNTLTIEVEDMDTNFRIENDSKASGGKAAVLVDENSYATANVVFPKGYYIGYVWLYAPTIDNSRLYVIKDGKFCRTYSDDPVPEGYAVASRTPIYVLVEEEQTVTFRLQKDGEDREGNAGVYLDRIVFTKENTDITTPRTERGMVINALLRGKLGCTETATAFKPSSTAPASGVRTHSLSLANGKAVAWKDGTTVYYYAKGYTDSENKIPLAEDCQGMFLDCTSLKEIDLSGFDTSNVTSMHTMFKNCTALTTLHISTFDTGKVTDMASMFNSCAALASLDVSSFNTSNVTDMNNMFYKCTSLTELDVSSFDTSKVTDMHNMFNGCDELTTIYAKTGADWSTSSVLENSTNMFLYSTKLQGGAGTTYKSGTKRGSSEVSAAYARIDGGENKPGFFTAK